MRSLARAIVARIVIALLAIGSMAVVASYEAARYEANEFMDDYLQQFADVIDPSAAVPHVGALREPEDRFERIVWKAGVKVSATPGAPKVFVQPTRPGFADIIDGGLGWRTFAVDRGDFTMMLAQKMSSREEMAQHAAFEISLVIAATMLVVWLIVVWSVNGIMRRLGALAARIAVRSVDAKDALPVDTLPREIRPLVEATNVLIGRLHAALTQQRRFIADSAHELRTPLAALRIQLDNLKAVGYAEVEAATSALGDGIARASAVLNQLLRLARFETPEARGEYEAVDLVELVTQCIADAVDIADDAGIDIGLTKIEPAVVAIVRNDLQHLVSNVIDNAIRYTPAGGTVDCEITRSDEEATVRIIDTGPGVRPADLPRLTERFFRAATLDIPGSGLGLSIVSAIADTYNLRLTIENRVDRSGLVVAIVFPRADAAGRPEKEPAQQLILS